jgi:hypothetical protein
MELALTIKIHNRNPWKLSSTLNFFVKHPVSFLLSFSAASIIIPSSHLATLACVFPFSVSQPVVLEVAHPD